MDYELVVLTTTDYGKKVADDVERAIGLPAQAGGKLTPTKSGSKITKTEDWGVKQLSYPIKKQSEALYFLFTLSLEPSEISPLDESLRRNENVLRHLLVRSDKRQVTSNKKEDKPKKTEAKKMAVKRKVGKK